MSKLLKIVGLLILTGLLAYFAGGFVAGVVWCKNCDGLVGNTVGRLFIGVVYLVLSATHGGFPPRDASGSTPPFNAWPYIIGCWLVFYSVAFLIFSGGNRR